MPWEDSVRENRMTNITPDCRPRRYRVWIAAYKNWQPADCHDVPPEAVVLEPAEEYAMTVDQAARYVEAFNRAALAAGRKIWAVALPVVLRYDGDPHPGLTLTAAAFHLGSPVS